MREGFAAAHLFVLRRLSLGRRSISAICKREKAHEIFFFETVRGW